MSNNISAVVFDAFGTLAQIGKKNSPYKQLLKWTYNQGRNYDPQDAHIIMGNYADFRSVSTKFSSTIPEKFMITLENQLKEELSSITLYEDTLETIRHLKASGLKIGVCSNLAMPYGEVLLSLLPEMDVYALSYTMGALKPQPKMYEHIIHQLDCMPRDVLFVGDTPLADVEGPLNFGMSARLIQRNHGQQLKHVLAEYF